MIFDASALVSSFAVVLSELAALFERERIAYMVIGGLAVDYWGVQRVTHDVDIALAFDPRNVRPLLEALQPQIDQISPHAAEWAVDTGIVRFRHRNGIPVDLGVSDSPYLVQALARAVDVDAEGHTVKFCTAEDLILHKLLADRDRDRSLKGIFKRQRKKLDRAYLDPLVEQLAESTYRPYILDRYRSLLSQREAR